LKSNPTSTQVRLGIRAHDIGRFSPDELARRVASNGLDRVQLALGKAIEGLEMGPGVIHPAMAGAIGSAFARHGVRIEVLGCYINPIHPDPETRRSLIGLFKEHLRYARSFGCNLVALESGSLNADYSPHPENGGEAAFLDLLEVMQELVEDAEQHGVVVGIEAVSSHVICTPERMRRLLDHIPSPHLQVVFDAVNLLSAENHESQRDIMQRSFGMFGDRIAVAHAKDFREVDGKLRVCPPGSGQLDYALLLGLLSECESVPALILEETHPDHLAASADFIRSMNPWIIS
jgi:sugar phosphate isomerase/epimerase